MADDLGMRLLSRRFSAAVVLSLVASTSTIGSTSPSGAGEALACGVDAAVSFPTTSSAFPTIAVDLDGDVITSTVSVVPFPSAPFDIARSTITGHGSSTFSVDVAINNMGVAPDGALWLVSGRVAPSNTVVTPAVYRRTVSGTLREIARPNLPALIGFAADGRAIIGSGFGAAVWMDASGNTQPLPEPPATSSTNRQVFFGQTYQFIRDSPSNRQWLFQDGALTEITSLDPITTVGESLAQLRDDHVALYAATSLLQRFEIAGVNKLTEAGSDGWIAEQTTDDGGALHTFLDRDTGEMTLLGPAETSFRQASRGLDATWFISARGADAYTVNRLLPPGEAPRSPSASELPDQVARLYEAYLRRAPDADGLRFWVDRRSTGSAIAEISEAFAQSPEFTNRYGQLSNADFVDLVYQNVLGREPDAAGASSWLTQLNAGLTRGAMMVGFSDSAELIGRTATTSPSSSADNQIYRLYRAYLLREPDAGGLCFWSQRLRSGQSLSEVSEAFASSQEFLDRYGMLDNEAFVRLIYDNVLGRAPEAAGLAFWTDQLGSQSRGSLMIGFSESPEYLVLTGTLP